MTNDEIYNLLESIGLHKNQARLYVVSLRLGPASVIQLGQKINDTRQMVYLLLPGLIEKGLMKRVSMGNKDYYKAISPEVLVEIAQNNKEKILQAIPILKSQTSEEKAIPLITVYENPLAMREWYKKYIMEAKKGDEILIWSTGGVSHWYSLDKEFYEKYLNFSEKEGVKTYVILPDTPESKREQEEVGKIHTKYKLFKNTWGGFAEKWVWKNQVCCLTIRENMTNMIVIESKDLAAIERFDFWQVWNSKN